MQSSWSLRVRCGLFVRLAGEVGGFPSRMVVLGKFSRYWSGWSWTWVRRWKTSYRWLGLDLQSDNHKRLFDNLAQSCKILKYPFNINSHDNKLFGKWKCQLVHHRGCHCVERWWVWDGNERKQWRWVELRWYDPLAR
jgi:hypothetical protein